MISHLTSESVCAGHPDKICDQISDAILDYALSKDTNSRVAVETLVTENLCVLAGEVTSKTNVPYEKIARSVIKDLGYTDRRFKFTYKSPVKIHIHSQSSEIACGVDEMGAGDQGMMYGFACDDGSNFMPLPITLAHGLTQQIDSVRTKGILPYLKPDGKAQVTIAYENDKPKQVEKVVLAVPHDEDVELFQVKEDLHEHVVLPVLQKYGLRGNKKNLVVNGTGVWHLGGPASDTGVTGRKIVVDTYGGIARVGGGAFSGKDPTKVDRSGAYAARYIAKNIVALRLAKRCEVRLAYVIGHKRPVMQDVETFGTENKSLKFIHAFVNKLIDTSVAGILKKLKLQRPLYFHTAAYGHFGRNGFPWEELVAH